jgi:hypothetical protein
MTYRQTDTDTYGLTKQMDRQSSLSLSACSINMFKDQFDEGFFKLVIFTNITFFKFYKLHFKLNDFELEFVC